MAKMGKITQRLGEKWMQIARKCQFGVKKGGGSETSTFWGLKVDKKGKKDTDFVWN